jgi:hypothetical protein
MNEVDMFLVPNAFARGMVQVDHCNNSEKRITGITGKFMEQTGIEPKKLLFFNLH